MREGDGRERVRRSMMGRDRRKGRQWERREERMSGGTTGEMRVRLRKGNGGRYGGNERRVPCYFTDVNINTSLWHVTNAPLRV